jgi:hypothetical protein
MGRQSHTPGDVEGYLTAAVFGSLERSGAIYRRAGKTVAPGRSGMVASHRPAHEEDRTVTDATAHSLDGPAVLHHWSARKVQPIVVLYVVAVFAVFAVVAHFVFHSTEAVKALAIAAFGAVAATVPGVMDRVEYRLTESGMEKRTVRKAPGPFQEVFRWPELSRVVPTGHGFKYFKATHEPNPLRRFWRRHFSDVCSGEVHVEREDLERVLGLVERRGVPVR